ncbi:MAG: glycosyltransferase [Candidatus Latescibacterota bacterium]|nr:MAG: glycosyltransferase [Candidatus Latescibacterota bacterium]
MTVVICMVTNMYPTEEQPGFGAFVKSQIDSIAAEGHEVSLLLIGGRASAWNYAAAIGRLRDMLNEKHFDIVHAHYGLSGLVACMQRACPVVVSFCGDDLLGTSNGRGGVTFKSRGIVWVDQLVALRADGVIVKSQKMRPRLRFASAREKAVVIPNGVDFGLFRPIDREIARKELGLPRDKRYVLFPSMPREPRKRVDLARDAVEVLKNDHPAAELLVLDKKPQREVPVYMGACDAMILTSDWEGSANVVKEAMACNLPVVSVDAGDAWEIIAGTAHCYEAKRDPNDLAAKLGQVLSAGERSTGRDRIEHLELSAVARRVVGVYEAVLTKG